MIECAKIFLIFWVFYKKLRALYEIFPLFYLLNFQKEMDLDSLKITCHFKSALHENWPKLISISFVSFQRKLGSEFSLINFIESVCYSYTILGRFTNLFNYNGKIFLLPNFLHLHEVVLAPKYTFWSIDSKCWMEEY